MVPKVMNQNANIQNVLPFPYRKIILKISYAFRKWGWGEGGDKVAHLVGKSYLASENNFEGYKGFLLSIVSLQGFFSEAAPEHRIQEIKEKQVCKFPMGICHLLWLPPLIRKEKKSEFPSCSLASTCQRDTHTCCTVHTRHSSGRWWGLLWEGTAKGQSAITCRAGHGLRWFPCLMAQSYKTGKSQGTLAA